jgi:hypothetical protein
MNLKNETDEKVRHNEQEMGDNEIEEREFGENDSEPKDKNHGAFQELRDNSFGRNL